MTQRILINRCWGGFGLSHEAVMEYGRRVGKPLYAFTDARGLDGRIKPGEYVPVNDADVPGAFGIYYFTTPEHNEDDYFSGHDITRQDATLIALFDEWGSARVSGRHAKLDVVDVPDGVAWEISEYDGMEHVAESHRTWQ